MDSFSSDDVTSLMTPMHHGNMTISMDMLGNISATTAATVVERAPSQDLISYMYRFLTPVIIAIGLCGNTLSLIVFMRTRLRRQSSSVYLAALCIADSAFLLQLTAAWLGYVRVFIYHKQGFCQAFVYTGHVSAFLSVWFVVAFTLERYIVCVYPLSKKHICTVQRAKLIVIGCSVVAALLYSYLLLTSEPVQVRGSTKPRCFTKTEYMSFTLIMGNLDTLLTLLIPSILIVFMNARIIVVLAKSSKFQSKMPQAQSDAQSIPLCTRTLSDTPSESKSTKSGSRKSATGGAGASPSSQQQRITKMLVTISSVFLLLNGPNHVIKIYLILVSYVKSEQHAYVISQRIGYWQHGFLFLYHINFAINFFLYSLCGRNFRNEIKALFCRAKRDRTAVVSQYTHSGY